MASTLKPEIVTYLADGAIAKGKAVKLGSDNIHVAVCSAGSDKAIGICQLAAVNAGDKVEVSVQDGAKGLAETTIAFGDLLVAHTDGSLKPHASGSSGDRIVGIAMDSAVVGDIFDMIIAMSVKP